MMTHSQAQEGDARTHLIGSRRVGRGEPVFVMAEAGVNHNGDLATALMLVDKAAAAGADAVKFQVFRASSLASREAESAGYQRASGATNRQREMLGRLELPDDALAAIKAHCDMRGILFLATPFSADDVDRLVTLGVCALKIASTDLTDVLLLRRAIDSALPLIVSTGAANLADIRDAVDLVSQRGGLDRLALLHCISAYPTPVSSLNLRAIQTLAEVFGVVSGLSDHSLSVETGAWAVAAGACYLEKHFTLDRHADGPDHAMSLDPSELTAYVERVRACSAACGNGALEVDELERDVQRVARKSVVALIDIPAGAVIAEHMIGAKRPGTGIAPGDIDRLIGKTASVDIANDTLLAWEMVR